MVDQVHVVAVASRAMSTYCALNRSVPSTKVRPSPQARARWGEPVHAEVERCPLSASRVASPKSSNAGCSGNVVGRPAVAAPGGAGAGYSGGTARSGDCRYRPGCRRIARIQNQGGRAARWAVRAQADSPAHPAIAPCAIRLLGRDRQFRVQTLGVVHGKDAVCGRPPSGEPLELRQRRHAAVCREIILRGPSPQPERGALARDGRAGHEVECGSSRTSASVRAILTPGCRATNCATLAGPDRTPRPVRRRLRGGRCTGHRCARDRGPRRRTEFAWPAHGWPCPGGVIHAVDSDASPVNDAGERAGVKIFCWGEEGATFNASPC